MQARPAERILSYLQELIYLATRVDNLSLALLGFPANKVPAGVGEFITHEYLQALGQQDVAQFLEQLRGRGFLDSEDVTKIVEYATIDLPVETKLRNRYIQERLSSTIREIVA